MNNFAVSSDGLAIALQDSASALMEAGNNLEQSVALIAAANKVLQDPNSVGSALRTISLRLRGTSVEVLQELGEETDGAVESVSKMQEKLKALTGVDILTDSGAYKDTYTILKEIAEVWETMDPMNQAAALELMAGKNRANALAAILGNIEDIKGAYESAINAEGSAMRENEAYLDSIQGRIDLFSNALQTFWMNLLNTDAIKGVVDLGTELLKFADTFIGKLTSIVAIITVYKKLKDKKTFAQMFDGAVEMATAFANSLKNTVVSTTGAQSAIQSLWGVIKANPLTAATVLVIGFAMALDALHTTAQEAADSAHAAFDEIRSVVESTQSTIQSLESELSTLGDKIDELSGKELSFADKEELNRLEKQREELEHAKKVQEQLLKLQTDSKNKQAVASMKAYTAAASQGAEETQSAWKTAGKILGGVIGVAGVAASVLIPGDFGTLGAGALAVAKALGSFGGMSAVGAGAFLGNKAGEAIGSERTKNDGTYDAWYDTYAKAIDTARAEEEKALKEYQNDHSNIDKLDKWQEAQQKTIDIETEMYDHLSQMQQYYSGLEYGQGFDKELDSWYNFLDKMSIDQEASGAIDTALDRIFGENASVKMQSIRDQILKAVAAGEDFDFESAINGSKELKSVLEYLGIDAKDLAGYFNDMGAAAARAALLASNIDSAQTYSKLSEKVSGYNDLIAQTAEIVSDNTKVTQEYKDALEALGISEEDLGKCFDENNELIVKDAKALNQLVKSASKNVATNVKLAKSQARLEYYDLVKQLNSTMRSTNVLDAATRNSIQSTLEQIDAVEKALYQYQLLEDTLLGVNNAFDKFAKAKDIDAMNTYGDSYVEMAQTMYDALYKTGQVGTEAFWSSVESLVPDSVYQGITEDADRMKAIYDYYNKNILPSLRLDDDSLSLDYDAVENFVKEGLSSGVFSGDTENFNLVEGMNLEKAAELMDITKTQAYALFAELDKYNTAGNEQSFLSQLDDSLEGRITNITNEVEDLNKQKLALLEDGDYEKNKDAIDDINEKLSQNEEELNKLGKEAHETWQQYTKLDAVIATLGAIEDKTSKISEDGAIALGLDWDEVRGQTVQQVLDSLIAKQLQLEEPTILTAQLQIDYIDGRIAELKQKLADAEQDPTVLGVSIDADEQTIESAKQAIKNQIQALEEEMAVVATEFGIELNEEQKATVQEELDAIEKFTINNKTFYVTVNGTDLVMKLLQTVNEYAKDKTKTITVKYKNGGGGSGRFAEHYVAEADGTAHAHGTAFKGGSWGAPRTETALVGELGPEMLVRNGRWTTIGDNGAEFTQVKKGDIIFNHKQTEDLLSKGHVTGRGKLHGGAFASGTAYSGLWQPTSPDKSLSNEPGKDFSHAASKLNNAADSLSDASDKFSEVFDWIEVRLEEINESISLNGAQLENKIGYSEQNKVIDNMIDLNQKLYDNLIAGANEYYNYSKKLLEKVPEAYRDAAQDGAIAIEAFTKEADQKTIEAIQEYREWVQKGADATQQAEEVLTEISNLAKQAIDSIVSDFDNKTSLNDSVIAQLEAYNSLIETDKGFESGYIYEAIIKANNENINKLKEQRDAMQAELNAQVEAGNIKKYSQNWYDAVNAISEVDTQIIELTTDTKNYQDTINELHWEHFDTLMSQYEMVADEAENLIDVLGSKDLVDKDTAEWTDDGITSLGLYAQQMEVAEMQAKKYEEEIAYLNKNWKKLGYTEKEYIEKLDELKSGQYDAIKAYNDTKDAIVDLNKERVDAIKSGIEREIDAYSELIEKKQEELDAEKD